MRLRSGSRRRCVGRFRNGLVWRNHASVGGGGVVRENGLLVGAQAGIGGRITQSLNTPAQLPQAKMLWVGHYKPFHLNI